MQALPGSQYRPPEIGRLPSLTTTPMNPPQIQLRRPIASCTYCWQAKSYRMSQELRNYDAMIHDEIFSEDSGIADLSSI